MKQIHAFPVLDGPMATASAYAMAFRDGDTPLHPKASPQSLRAAFGGPLPEQGVPGEDVISDLIAAAAPGLVGTPRSGFFAWVMGGSNKTAVAADWLTSVWGQNAGIYECSPAAATAEDVACGWLLDALDLPREASVGLTTGATMGGFIALAAARDAVLRRLGCDVAKTGLQSAPRITVFVCDDTHTSNRAALRYLGLGTDNVVEIPSDDQGRMCVETLRRKIARRPGPKVVVATAGNIHSGAFDDFEALADLAAAHGAWLHVDGAFGLWARCCAKTRALTNGIDRADSWSVDGHKWLQVPFDAGFAIVRNRDAHRRAMDISASYLPEGPETGRNATHYVPELSRRARGFPVWAAFRAFGREGIADMVCNHCDCAALLGYKLRQRDGIEIVNDVVLNQVAIRFDRGRGAWDTDRVTQSVADALNSDGAQFVRTSVWKGRRVLRISVTGEQTGPVDMQRLAAKIAVIWDQLKSE
ncbi:MAG: aspartate aminotransferase family protein [Pseudomonadota bacterium]